MKSQGTQLNEGQTPKEEEERSDSKRYLDQSKEPKQFHHIISSEDVRNHSQQNSTDQHRPSEVYESADLTKDFRQNQTAGDQNEELL